MSEIEKLADLLRFSSAELGLRLDSAAEAEGTAWLDVERQGRVVAVEWRPQQGFGVSLLDAGDPLTGLFEGPDEILGDPYSARDRVLSLLEPTSARHRTAARR